MSDDKFGVVFGYLENSEGDAVGRGEAHAALLSLRGEITRLSERNGVLEGVLDGLTQDHIDGGWTAKGISAHCAKQEHEITQLQTALGIKNGSIEQLKARVAELETQQVNTAQPALTVGTLYTQPADRSRQHPDDQAVDRFAVAMKAKLARSREKGRYGWQTASAAYLGALLYHHMYKGDPLDVANLAMMLHENHQTIELPQDARRTSTEQPSAARVPEGWRELMRRASNILGSQGFEAWKSLASEIDAMLAAAPKDSAHD